MAFINSIPSSTSIATSDIQADAITNAKIADDAINSEHYTDGSIDTAHVADNQITTAKIGYAEATLTDGSTISWDASTSDVAKVTLGGNRTLGAASNGTTGQFVSLLIIQDGTGSRTLTWNAVYEFKDDTAPTLTTTAAKGDLFVIRYNGSKNLEVERNTNLTVQLKSSHPSPATLHSMNWEGDYNSRNYRRA